MAPRKLIVALAAVLMGTGLAVLAATPAAVADMTPQAAAAALDLPAGISVTGTSGNPDSRTVADTIAAGETRFNDFPSKGTSYLMLSTGDAGDVFAGPSTAQLSTDFGGDYAPDASSLTLTIAQGTPNAGCLFVDFAMGTEERTHYNVETTPSDFVSIKRGSDPTVEYAQNAGRAYFSQPDWPTQPKSYAVNAIDYWHTPGDPADPLHGTVETPRLPAVTGLNHVTTRDTARIPIDVTAAPETVEVLVADANNGDLDSVAFIDNVRVAQTCSNGSGVEPVRNGRIVGHRGVGNVLTYDPNEDTPEIERYDTEANGWRSPSGTLVELRFRWYRNKWFGDNSRCRSGSMADWIPLPDADRQSYVPGNSDKDHCLIVLVTGMVDGRRPETFPSTATVNDAEKWYVTLPIQDGIFDGSQPTISGTAKVGGTLHAAVADTTPRQDSWSWQWYANGQPISGQTGQTMVLTAAEGGKTITVRAIAHRNGFDSREFISDPVGPVQRNSMVSAGSPTIFYEGEPVPGTVLTAAPGPGWAPQPALDEFTYQWQANGQDIRYATNQNYTLTASEVGKNISVVVSGAPAGYEPLVATTTSVKVAGLPMAGVTPTISGTAKVGAVLSGSAPGWSPATAKLTYEWWAGATLLQSGFNSRLTIPPTAAGKRVVLKVIGTQTSYETTTMESAPTALVARGTLVPAVPRIIGIAKVGRTLAVSPGYWAPGGVRFSYRWKVGSRVVSGPAGARDKFKIPRTAWRKRITVTVTGSRAGYNTVMRTSRPTAAVVR